MHLAFKTQRHIALLLKMVRAGFINTIFMSMHLNEAIFDNSIIGTRDRCRTSTRTCSSRGSLGGLTGALSTLFKRLNILIKFNVFPTIQYLSAFVLSSQLSLQLFSLMYFQLTIFFKKTRIMSWNIFLVEHPSCQKMAAHSGQKARDIHAWK